MKVIDKKTAAKLSLCVLAGAAAGFVNGFLGAGGGIILLWIFSRMNPEKSAAALRNSFASVVFAVLLLSTVSAVSYSHTGNIDTTALLSLALPGALGGVIGAHLTDKLDTFILKMAFSVLIIIAGINMIR